MRILLLVAFLLPFSSSVAVATDRDIELRGTLLCRVDGDARRERPIDSQMLIVEPVGHPPGAEVIGEAGLFRVRVPESFVDHQVILRIHQGREEVHSLTIFLDAARVKQVGDRRVCQLGAFPLPGQCDDRSGTAAEAVMIRDEIRRATGSTATVSTPGGSKLWKGGVVAVLAGAGAAALGGAAGASGGDQGGILPMPGAEPNDWPVFQQFCASPALGRTVTTRRDPGEAALWNPSALVLPGASHLSIGYGEDDELRGSLAWQLPVSATTSRLVPRTVSLATVARLGNESAVDTALGSGIERTIESFNQDVMVTAALGWLVDDDVAVAVGFRGIWQERGSRIDEPGKIGASIAPLATSRVIDQTREHDSQGVDLTMTWDARPDLRVGIGAYSLFGGEYQDSVSQSTPLSRGAFGAAWNRGRWSIAVESGLNAGDLGVSAAVDFRAASWLGLSVAAGSRYEVLQGGVDLTAGPLTGQARIRTDELDDLSGWFGLTLSH